MTFPVEAPGKLSAAAGYRAWLAAAGVSLGIALLIVSPFFWLGTASGHDISFHASSWLDAAGQWKEGILFPRWAEWANYGFGEPRFIFYPPLSWTLGAALGFVAPWNAVPDVFIVLVQTLAGVSMFALARQFFSPGAAVVGAACYAANPYALLVVYMRSDFAEELACAFLPLLLLATLQLCGLVENRRRSPLRATAVFALLFALMWLSNAPAGVMASYGVALLFAWAAFRQKSFTPMLRGAGGLALGFGLSCFYLVPAAYEQRWVSIVQALSSGLRPEQNFLYSQINDPEHNLFNWIASTAAVMLIVMTAVAAILAHRSMKKGETDGEQAELWWSLLLLSAAATVLMLKPAFVLWEYLPKLRFVQFPWRWTGVLAVPYAYFCSAAVARRSAWIWICIVILACGGSGIFLVHQAWWDSDDIPSLQDAIANDQGFEGTDEYDPAGDDHYNLPQNAPPVQILPSDDSPGFAPKAEVHVARWSAENKELDVVASEPLRLAIRLLDYPAWRVEMDGRPLTPEHAESTAQMVLPLPAGAHQISVRFRNTPDRSVANGLSFISLVVCGAFLRTVGAGKFPFVRELRSICL